MKMTGTTERDKKILSSVKREMAQPRLAASVRKVQETEAARAAKALASSPARA